MSNMQNFRAQTSDFAFSNITQTSYPQSFAAQRTGMIFVMEGRTVKERHPHTPITATHVISDWKTRNGTLAAGNLALRIGFMDDGYLPPSLSDFLPIPGMPAPQREAIMHRSGMIAPTGPPSMMAMQHINQFSTIRSQMAPMHAGLTVYPLQRQATQIWPGQSVLNGQGNIGEMQQRHIASMRAGLTVSPMQRRATQMWPGQSVPNGQSNMVDMQHHNMTSMHQLQSQAHNQRAGRPSTTYAPHFQTHHQLQAPLPGQAQYPRRVCHSAPLPGCIPPPTNTHAPWNGLIQRRSSLSPSHPRYGQLSRPVNGHRPTQQPDPRSHSNLQGATQANPICLGDDEEPLRPQAQISSNPLAQVSASDLAITPPTQEPEESCFLKERLSSLQKRITYSDFDGTNAQGWIREFKNMRKQDQKHYCRLFWLTNEQAAVDLKWVLNKFTSVQEAYWKRRDIEVRKTNPKDGEQPLDWTREGPAIEQDWMLEVRRAQRSNRVMEQPETKQEAKQRRAEERAEAQQQKDEEKAKAKLQKVEERARAKQQKADEAKQQRPKERSAAKKRKLLSNEVPHPVHKRQKVPEGPDKVETTPETAKAGGPERFVINKHVEMEEVRDDPESEGVVRSPEDSAVGISPEALVRGMHGQIEELVEEESAEEGEPRFEEVSADELMAEWNATIEADDEGEEAVEGQIESRDTAVKTQQDGPEEAPAFEAASADDLMAAFEAYDKEEQSAEVETTPPSAIEKASAQADDLKLPEHKDDENGPNSHPTQCEEEEEAEEDDLSSLFEAEDDGKTNGTEKENAGGAHEKCGNSSDIQGIDLHSLPGERFYLVSIPKGSVSNGDWRTFMS